MGTRSITSVYDEKDKPILTLYKQYDGYPQDYGLGRELWLFLADRKIVNGYGSEALWTPVSNGMRDLASQLVAYLKGGGDGAVRTGDVYIHRLIGEGPEAEAVREACDSTWAEYCYCIRFRQGRPEVSIWAYDDGWEKPGDPMKRIFRGLPEELPEAFEMAPGKTVSERMRETAMDRAAGTWLMKNVSFTQLSDAVGAYCGAEGRGSFADFVKSRINPVPRLRGLEKEALNMDNIDLTIESARLSKIAESIETYARHVDPRSTTFREWFEKTSGLRADDMANENRPAHGKAPRQ